MSQELLSEWITIPTLLVRLVVVILERIRTTNFSSGHDRLVSEQEVSRKASLAQGRWTRSGVNAARLIDVEMRLMKVSPLLFASTIPNGGYTRLPDSTGHPTRMGLSQKFKQ